MLLPITAMIASSTLLLADDEARMRNLENRLTSLECSQDRCCVINPPARPYPAECWGFYVTVDPLIWQAHVGGLPLATQTSGSTNFFNNVGSSRVKNLKFDWDWGFRIGLGVNTTHDAWDVLLQWTYWNPDGRRNFRSSSDSTNFPHVGHPARTFNQTAGQVDGDWKMHYNVLDLENGREFYVSKFLSLRPHAGFRTLWIEQDYDVAYTELSPTTNPVLPTNRHDIDQNDRFWGLGIRGGIDTQWGVCWGWSLFSNYAGSLLYSYHKVHHREKGDPVDANTTLRVDDFHHVGSAIFDMQIGVRWDWLSCDCCYHLGLDLGWEHHWHPGQNQFLFFVDDGMDGKFVTNQGDLGIQGFFFRARFDF